MKDNRQSHPQIKADETRNDNVNSASLVGDDTNDAIGGFFSDTATTTQDRNDKTPLKSSNDDIPDSEPKKNFMDFMSSFRNLRAPRRRSSDGEEVIARASFNEDTIAIVGANECSDDKAIERRHEISNKIYSRGHNRPKWDRICFFVVVIKAIVIITLSLVAIFRYQNDNDKTKTTPNGDLPVASASRTEGRFQYSIRVDDDEKEGKDFNSKVITTIIENCNDDNAVISPTRILTCQNACASRLCCVAADVAGDSCSDDDVGRRRNCLFFREACRGVFEPTDDDERRAATTRLAEICSVSNIASNRGFGACQKVCRARACCFLEGRCQQGNEGFVLEVVREWCDEFKDCENLLKIIPSNDGLE